MGKHQWSLGGSIEKWGQLTENAFIYNNYHSSNNSISLIYTYGNGDIEKHNMLKLGALAESQTSILPFLGLYFND